MGDIMSLWTTSAVSPTAKPNCRLSMMKGKYALHIGWSWIPTQYISLMGLFFPPKVEHLQSIPFKAKLKCCFELSTLAKLKSQITFNPMHCKGESYYDLSVDMV